ncbi:helix-turn-helix domain-containing protein [Xenorhabdus bharatensis]|uniref:helix-turn-helix domain-containing protein n=1 Tax=Xenorhabdus bharatensis TaxID=3136256 RepID=UPI0030F39AD7
MKNIINEKVIKDLVYWIEKNIENELNIDIVAKKSGYSKWHLQRIFKNITGTTLGSYIIERRLSNAAISICSSKNTLYNVALQYQFDSQQSFSRSFKKHFGITPSEWRKNLNSNNLFSLVYKAE